MRSLGIVCLLSIGGLTSGCDSLWQSLLKKCSDTSYDCPGGDMGMAELPDAGTFMVDPTVVPNFYSMRGDVVAGRIYMGSDTGAVYSLDTVKNTAMAPVGYEEQSPQTLVALTEFDDIDMMNQVLPVRSIVSAVWRARENSNSSLPYKTVADANTSPPDSRFRAYGFFAASGDRIDTASEYGPTVTRTTNRSIGFVVGEGGKMFSRETQYIKYSGTGIMTGGTDLTDMGQMSDMRRDIDMSGPPDRFIPTKWQPVPLVNSGNLYAIHGNRRFHEDTVRMAMPTSFIWAVGAKSLILEYTGSGWNTIFMAAGQSSPDFYAVYALQSTNDPYDSSVWVAGSNGSIYNRPGRYISFSQMQFPDTTVNLYAIWAFNDSDVVVAGSGGKVYRLTGGTWLDLAAPAPSNVNLRAIWASSPGEFYVAGDQGTLLRFSGSAWLKLPYQP